MENLLNSLVLEETFNEEFYTNTAATCFRPMNAPSTCTMPTLHSYQRCIVDVDQSSEADKKIVHPVKH